MFQASKETLALLDDIERRIDPETEEDFKAQWRGFLSGDFSGDLFQAARKKLSPPSYPVPSVNINDAIEDYDQMLQYEFGAVSRTLNDPEHCLNFRANYGTGIMTSLFGAEIFMMPREKNTLPTTYSFNDTERIRRVVDQGKPDWNTGLGAKVLAFGEICAELLQKYPKISRYAVPYHPDLQGPLDVCELLWGGEMFYAMYDEPELVHDMLSLITDTYTDFMNKWCGIFPLDEEINAHWGFFHRGKIVLRDDSAMNLSPELYQEFAAPYDGELLRRFQGGAIHFCGRGDHYIDTLCNLPGLYGINMSQPEYNDMEKIYRNTVEKGIKILSFSKERAKKDVTRPGAFHHNLSI